MQENGVEHTTLVAASWGMKDESIGLTVCRVGRDVCSVDSGEPLHRAGDWQYTVGLVPFGQYCSHRDKRELLGVYTYVSPTRPLINYSELATAT